MDLTGENGREDLIDAMDIAFDLSANQQGGGKSEEIHIDLCDDLLPTDKQTDSAPIDLGDHYVPPTITTEGKQTQPDAADHIHSQYFDGEDDVVVTTVKTQDTKADEDDEFEFDGEIPTAAQAEAQHDDDFDFDPAPPKENTSSSSITQITTTTKSEKYKMSSVTPQQSTSPPQQSKVVEQTTTTSQTITRSENETVTMETSDSIVVRSQDVDDFDVKLSFDTDKNEPVSGQMANNDEIQLSFGDEKSPEEVGVKEGDLNDLLQGLGSAGKSENEKQVDEFDFDVRTDGDGEKEEEKQTSESQPVASQIATPPVDPKAALVANGLISEEAVGNQDPSVENEALQAAQDEWDTVQTVIPEVCEGESVSKPRESTKIISYHEALDHLQASNLMQYKPSVKTCIERRGFAAIKHALFGPPKLHKQLQADRDQVFCMAACQLDNSDRVHSQMLMALYRKLTGSKFDCQRFGSHWEQIGFQGNDPATDLRGCGMLGLMQLLHLVSTPRTAQLARQMYSLSLHDQQNYPFCIMGINVTRMVIQALREDILNKELNKHKQVMEVINNFYTATFYHLYYIWKSQHKTIADTGFVIKDVQTMTKKKPQVLLANLEQYLEQQKSGKGGAGAQAEEPMSFEGVCDFDD